MQPRRLERQLLPFGEGMKLRRIRLGLTVRGLGEIIGNHHTTVVKLEQKVAPPKNQDLLKRLADALQGTPEELRIGYVPPNFPLQDEIPDTSAAGVLDNMRGFGLTAEQLETAGLGEMLMRLPEVGDLQIEDTIERYKDLPDADKQLAVRQLAWLIDTLTMRNTNSELPKRRQHRPLRKFRPLE